MISKQVFKIIGSLLVLLALNLPAASADWPRFRGLNGDGVSSESGLLDSWPDNGPQRLWEKPLGEGYSELIVVGSKVYTMAQLGEEPEVFLLAFHGKDGKEIWRTRIGEGYESDWGNGPRATPFYDNGALYTLGPQGDFTAVSAKDGGIIWSIQLVDDLKADLPGFGFSGSPVVEGNKVYLEIGAGDEGLFAAFDKNTGKELWRALKGGAGYMTPRPATIHETRQLIFMGPKALNALDMDGKLLWSHPWNNLGETIATPVFIAPDRIFLSSVKSGQSLLIRVDKNADGFSTRDLWKNKNLKNHFSASIQFGENLYGFDNAAFKCVSLKDGATVWQKRGFGKGSLILVENKLLVLSDRGLLAMVSASPDGFQELARFQALSGRCWTSPTLSNGRLFLRNHEKIACYNLAKSTEMEP